MGRKSAVELLIEENQELKEQLGNLGNTAHLIQKFKSVAQVTQRMAALLSECRSQALPLHLARQIDAVLEELNSLDG